MLAQKFSAGPVPRYQREMGWRQGRTTFAGILVDGARVLARHWPQLVVLFLAVAALRMAVLWRRSRPASAARWPAS